MDITSIDTVVQELEMAFQNTVETAMFLADEEWLIQYHNDLSPMAWHVGHTVFIESHWIREELLEIPLNMKGGKEVYFPWLLEKQTRSKKVPEKSKLLEEVRSIHLENMQLLDKALVDFNDHPMLVNSYLPLFLIQHYYQHRETMKQILLQRAIARHNESFAPRQTIDPSEPELPDVFFDSTCTSIGCQESPLAYDNEIPAHKIDLDAFRIARNSVSNSEYLGFMLSDGYERKEFWSNDGWQWLEKNQVDSPIHWIKGDSNFWYQKDVNGDRDLQANEPVTGISFYEAQAFAQYAGARLPGEAEWEHAIKNSASIHKTTGRAWEWCGNSFYAYPGYKAFPYDRYSRPWFDGRHYTLKGGSSHTHDIIKRPTFRNFYTADIRHVFAGLRLAQNG